MFNLRYKLKFKMLNVGWVASQSRILQLEINFAKIYYSLKIAIACVFILETK